MDKTIDDRFQRIELLFDEFREKFSAFMGALKGDEGQGGLLPEIKADLDELKTGQRHHDEKLSTMATQAIRDKAETEKAIADLGQQINNVANIARGADSRANTAQKNLECHIRDVEEGQTDRRRFSINTLIAALAVLVAVLVPLIMGG